MNILLIVITLLMIFTGITYSRIEIFRAAMLQRAEHEKYISSIARKDYNAAQIKLKGYNRCSPQQLKLNWLLQRGKNTTENNIAERYKTQLMELMNVLYSRAPFFIETQKKNPEFVGQLVNALIIGVDKLQMESVEKTKSFREEIDLAKIPIENPDLLNAFHLMLKGTKKKISANYDSEKNSRTPLDDSEYYSLIDFVKYENRQAKIKSASPELLDVFFEPNFTDEIIALRIQLEGTDDKDEKADLQKQLNAFTEKLRRPDDRVDIDLVSECDVQPKEDNKEEETAKKDEKTPSVDPNKKTP